ncbi:putative oxidoreductase [Pseudomonas sp. M47T1]|nr:putative oxidoreductase [Pseudomonas sp. M47T1]
MVGYGRGGRVFHAPLLASLADATWVGVVTRSAERRAQLAIDFPGVPAFDSLAQLVEAGVDAVVISTSLKGRPGLVLEAIEHGVAVVSDKPFAADADQARVLVQAAERQGVPISVYQNRRWDSDFLTVRKLLDSGVLGHVHRFESAMERFEPDSVGNESGGGWLRDLGSHLVDQALQLFGPVTQVYAELEQQAQFTVDHGFFVSLTHASGVVSHLYGHALQSAPRPRFRVSGEHGSYSVDGLDVQSEQAEAGLTPASAGGSWGVEEHRRWGWFEQGGEREKVPSERGDWPQFYHQLQAAVDQGEALPVDAWDAVQALVVLDAARLSARRHEVVTLEAANKF